jgi:hypothetical protein
MKNKLIPALIVLLLTPGLLFAARPSVSSQEQALIAIDQKLDETLAKIDAIDEKLSAFTSSVEWPYSSDCYFCDRVGARWRDQFRSTFYLGDTPIQTCISYCSSNWSDQKDSCDEVCKAAVTGELSDCTADASATLEEKVGFRSSCSFGALIPLAPVTECQADPADPKCQSYADDVIRTLTCVASTAYGANGGTGYDPCPIQRP